MKITGADFRLGIGAISFGFVAEGIGDGSGIGDGTSGASVLFA
jgi:hypothetical protein